MFVGASVIPTALTTINIATTDRTDCCDIPTWYMGDEWIIYRGSVPYYSDNGSFNGKIENLKREVVGIITITHDDEQFEVYGVDITGDITGELTWELLSGDLEGYRVKTLLIIDDGPPDYPVINGQTSGKVGEEYDYEFFSTDPDGGDLYYFVEWSDDTNSGWKGPFESGVKMILSHKWDEEDTYTIRAKAKDTLDVESPWSTLEVTMPVNQYSYSFPLLQRLLELFPNAFPILRNLLKL